MSAMPDISDLIGIPYREHGRDSRGYDCYGLAIEVERRLGKTLLDAVYDNTHDERFKDMNCPTLNIKPTDKIELGTLIEMTLKGELHIGVCLDRDRFIHATVNQGVRISSLRAFSKVNFYEVTKWE